LFSTLGTDAYGHSQIKTWFQRFTTGDFSCQDFPLALGSQFEAFLRQYTFASSRMITRHFLASVPTVKAILRRELGMRKFSRRSVPHLLSETPKIARIDVAKEMLPILQSCEPNDFDVIATGDES
jgi:hypothetical protein